MCFFFCFFSPSARQGKLADAPGVIPPVRGYVPRTRLELAGVTRTRTAEKKDQTKPRLCRRVVSSSPRRCICRLISHRHMRGFPASAVPLKSSRRVCFCQALACFGDYIFVPLLSSASQEFTLYLLTHTSAHARAHGARRNISTVSLLFCFFFLFFFWSSSFKRT